MASVETHKTNPSSNSLSKLPKNGSAHRNGVLAEPATHAPDDGRYVTKEEYMANYYENHPDANYEWNDGYLEAKPVASVIQAKMHLWFLMLLHHFLQENPIAERMLLEIGFDLTVPDPKDPDRLKDSVRKPDIGIVRNDNPVTLHEHDRTYKGTCDLCVESLSTSSKREIERDITTKKAEYEFVGVKEYYILDPTGEEMAFYELNSVGKYVNLQPDENGVIRSNVLPGFEFRLADLYERPDYKDIALNPVYRGYLMLDYQSALLRAANAEAQLETTEAQLENERAARKKMEEELRHLRAQTAKSAKD